MRTNFLQDILKICIHLSWCLGRVKHDKYNLVHIDNELGQINNKKDRRAEAAESNFYFNTIIYRLLQYYMGMAIDKHAFLTNQCCVSFA